MLPVPSDPAASSKLSCPRCRIVVVTEGGACPRCGGALVEGSREVERVVSPVMLFGIPLVMVVAVVAVIVVLSKRTGGPGGEPLMGVNFSSAEAQPDGGFVARGGPLTPSTVPERMSVTLTGGVCTRIAWRSRLLADHGDGPGELAGEYACGGPVTELSPPLHFVSGQHLTAEVTLTPVGGPITKVPEISVALIAPP